MLVPRRHCITVPHGSIAMAKHPSERFQEVTGIVMFAPSYASDDYVWLDDEQCPADQAPPVDVRL
jgi:hypothetical protein